MAIVDEIVAMADQEGFSGTIRIDVAGECLLDRAFGLADRSWGIANTPGTRFGMASGSKVFTALTVLSLVEDGDVGLDDPVRSVLGADLPRLDERITLRHLLSHTSGVGEYLDDDAEPDAYLMPGSAHSYADVESFLPLVDLPMASEPGQFAYSNSGFVMLAVIIQRVSGESFQDAVRRHVFRPAGLQNTDFLRCDELPGDVAIGYLWPDRLRSNVFHLPVNGSGDGGAYTTTADLMRFWRALGAGAIVSEEIVQQMTTPGEGHNPDDPYGLGLWLPRPGDWQIEGADAGVSMMSRKVSSGAITWTVLSNDSDGAWPPARMLRAWSNGSGGVGSGR